MADRNVIGSNTGDGIAFTSGSTTVTGNYIGTDPTGVSARPNGGYGISFGGAGNIIGGATSGAGNLISGNSVRGINVSAATGATIKGNTIGLNSLGQPLANASFGVGFVSGATGNMLGGTGAGDGNTIANNGSRGVSVDGATTLTNSIRGNSIYSNGGAGIELASGGNGASPRRRSRSSRRPSTARRRARAARSTSTPTTRTRGACTRDPSTATGTTWSFTGRSPGRT